MAALEGKELVFGLDIGTRSIVGTVGYKDGSRFHIVAQRAKEHETRAMLDGQIHDIGKVGATIAEVKSMLEQDLGRRLTQVCIAAAGRVLRTVTTSVEYTYGMEKEITNEDIYALDGLKRTKILDNLVKALAMQIGSEVNLNELAGLTGADRKTVENYIDLLEKTYVVFSLPAFSGNMRNEIKKGRKIYFYDLGVRNAVMGSFCRTNSRTDRGGMWENYLILERLKKLLNQPFQPQRFFWRTAAPQSREIDYLEKTSDTLRAWEIKMNPESRAKIPLSFRNAYPGATTEILTPENYDTFLLPE